MYHPITHTHPPRRIYSPELLRKVNSDQSSKILRDVRKNCFDYVFGVPSINMRIQFKLKILYLTLRKNHNIKGKTVNTTNVYDVRLGVMNVSSLCKKMYCVIDHITDNRFDIVGVTEI